MKKSFIHLCALLSAAAFFAACSDDSTDSSCDVECALAANAKAMDCENDQCIVKECNDGYKVSSDKKSCESSGGSAASCSADKCEKPANAKAMDCENNACVVKECNDGYKVSGDKKSCESSALTCDSSELKAFKDAFDTYVKAAANLHGQCNNDDLDEGQRVKDEVLKISALNISLSGCFDEWKDKLSDADKTAFDTYLNTCFDYGRKNDEFKTCEAVPQNVRELYSKFYTGSHVSAKDCSAVSKFNADLAALKNALAIEYTDAFLAEMVKCAEEDMDSLFTSDPDKLYEMKTDFEGYRFSCEFAASGKSCADAAYKEMHDAYLNMFKGDFVGEVNADNCGKLKTAEDVYGAACERLNDELVLGVCPLEWNKEVSAAETVKYDDFMAGCKNL